MGKEGIRKMWIRKTAALLLLVTGLLTMGTGMASGGREEGPAWDLAVRLLTGIWQVWAAEGDGGQWVYDQAGLFSEEEEAELEKELSAMKEETGMELVLVTTADAEGKTAEAYGDDFFDERGFGGEESEGGILYLIDMDNRELYISTYSGGIRLLTDERIGHMLDRGVPELAEGNYVGCARQMLRDTWEYYRQGIVQNQYNQDRDTGEIDYYKEKPGRRLRWYEGLLALAVSAFCAGSVCQKVRRDYRMEKEQKMASGYRLSYRGDAAFRFQVQKDEMRDSHTTRQVIPRTSTRRVHGGGSSGRSTTHTARSGRVHGGGGRKF